MFVTLCYLMLRNFFSWNHRRDSGGWGLEELELLLLYNTLLLHSTVGTVSAAVKLFLESGARTFKQSLGARNRVGIGLL